MFRKQFAHVDDACALAGGIVDTMREPVVILDSELRVIGASRSFYRMFSVKPEAVQGRLLYELDDDQWDIPKLRHLLEEVIPQRNVIDDFEVDQVFPGIGHRTMLLNARQIFYDRGVPATILIGIEDVTQQRVLERENGRSAPAKGYPVG